MIVISDTTPLRHLIAIGKADLLGKLYQAVTIPAGVWKELQADSTPHAVSAWMSAPPDWLHIHLPPLSGSIDLLSSALDPGEREAIQLAIELKAGLLLMDDRDGRAMASVFICV